MMVLMSGYNMCFCCQIEKLSLNYSVTPSFLKLCMLFNYVGHRQGDFNSMDMGNMGDPDHSNMDSDDLVPSLQVSQLSCIKSL